MFEPDQMTCIPSSFIKDCLKTFEPDEQLDRLIEECAELIQACEKIKRAVYRHEIVKTASLKEEMAHVLISSEIAAILLHVSPNDILKEVAKKAIEYDFDLSNIPLKVDG
jgi:NTP pyrophosphatase (non-canonical NTP hydrolase)